MTDGDVYRALRRHWFLIVVLTAVYVGAAWYATSRQTAHYQASSLVRLQQPGAGGGNAYTGIQASQLLAQSYASIIGSGALDKSVGSVVERKTGGSASGLTLNAHAVSGLDMLWIDARSRNAVVAEASANAAPQALRTFIRKSNMAKEDVIVVKSATAPGSLVSTHKKLYIALALLLGLIVNGALVLFLETLRDRLPDTDQLGESVGHPVLASIPLLQLGSMPKRDREGRQRADTTGRGDVSRSAGR